MLPNNVSHRRTLARAGMQMNSRLGRWIVRHATDAEFAPEILVVLSERSYVSYDDTRNESGTHSVLLIGRRVRSRRDGAAGTSAHSLRSTIASEIATIEQFHELMFSVNSCARDQLPWHLRRTASRPLH